jgi:hypothetical protein
VLANDLCVAHCFGLGKALNVDHFLGVRELSANVCPESGLNACSPAAKSACRDAIAKHQVPTGFVDTWLAFCARFEAVNLAVHLNVIWWLKASGPDGVNELRLWGCNDFLWWWRPRAAEDVT